MIACFVSSSQKAVLLEPLREDQVNDAIKTEGAALGFRGKVGQILPSSQRIYVGLGKEPDPLFGDLWAWAAIAEKLGAGDYKIDAPLSTTEANRACLAWGLAQYRFEGFKSKKEDIRPARLCWPQHAEKETIKRILTATGLVRDLINTPTSHMGPEELAAAAESLASEQGADIRIICGQELLDESYPAIHAVGRASAQQPRLIDLRWGKETDPKVTLVGKGVCFDTGGLNLKPDNFMKLMKKDMGGAAHMLGLTQMIMAAKLPIRLRTLIPAVENSVSGNALRPLDVITMRNGKTIEIGHTDAEGRVILADALAEASSEKPALIIDCATLTGAARVALGTDLPALFCNDEALAESVLGAAEAEADPLWRLPLWSPYQSMITGKTADLSNDAESRYGGAITAALFLREFVGEDIAWIHIDLMGWNVSSKPGRPEGGEAMGLRALFRLLQDRFG